MAELVGVSGINGKGDAGAWLSAGSSNGEVAGAVAGGGAGAGVGG